jgi:site-specific recombinase XerC
MLARGALMVQELLGHASAQTTLHYTQENIKNLSRRYLRVHSRENEHRAVVQARKTGREGKPQ